jgi:hypothetical protein
VFLLKRGLLILGWLILAHLSLLDDYHTHLTLKCSQRSMEHLIWKMGTPGHITRTRNYLLPRKQTRNCSHANSHHVSAITLSCLNYTFLYPGRLCTLSMRNIQSCEYQNKFCDGLPIFVFKETGSNNHRNDPKTPNSNNWVVQGMFTEFMLIFNSPVLKVMPWKCASFIKMLCGMSVLPATNSRNDKIPRAPLCQDL